MRDRTERPMPTRQMGPSGKREAQSSLTKGKHWGEEGKKGSVRGSNKNRRGFSAILLAIRSPVGKCYSKKPLKALGSVCDQGTQCNVIQEAAEGLREGLRLMRAS